MAGAPAAGGLGRSFLALLVPVLVVAPRAVAFEFFEGRLQVHGFLEAQVRSIGRDFSFTDGQDLSQWYNVLNVEIEYEVAPDGFGPFDLISTFARVEARYDCIWTRGCGMFPSVNAWGDRAERLPKRLVDAQRAGFTGTVETGDNRTYAGVGRDSETDTVFTSVPGAANPNGFDSRFPEGFLNSTQLSFAFAQPYNFPFSALDPGPFDFTDDQRVFPVSGHREPVPFFGIPGIETLFGTRGVDQILGVNPITEVSDDAAAFVFSRQLKCIFGLRKIKGNEDGRFRQTLGPWNPECPVYPNGRLRDKPNPFDPRDVNPILAGAANDRGSTAQPFRPFPEFAAGSGAPKQFSQGVYYPNRALRNRIRDGSFGSYDQNFSQTELAWNHGASQQDERELKELYADLELFDSRLWMRVGKQSIVWGKTELFRTTDQFNPQDVALATLPSLEESRIALWAVRGVWSFYEVGPFEDTRLELAANFDDFEPADIGRCGEPFTPNPACNKTAGLFAHGLVGYGVAGEIRPDEPTRSLEGVEVGGRLEWRWGRFSLQLSDFWGYNDFPHAERLFSYERNVDPLTGRPRRLAERGPCTDGTQAACLGFASTGGGPAGNPFTDLDEDGNPDRNFDVPTDDPQYGEIFVPEEHRIDVVRNTAVNQQLFAMICSTSIGFSDLDPTVCAQSVLTSKNRVTALLVETFQLTHLVGALLGGSPAAVNLVGSGSGLVPLVNLPLVPLNLDPRDNTIGSGDSVNGTFLTGAEMSLRLTPEQEALFGCGPYYGTHCDDDGPDLLNAEGSVIVQSWPGFDGTTGQWRTDVGIQPGTLGFVGGSPCLRWQNGTIYILPGCRGPDYTAATLSATLERPVVGDYDPLIDGCTGPGPFGCNDGDTVLVDTDGDGTPEAVTRSGNASTLAIPNANIDQVGGPGIDRDGDGDQDPAFGDATGQRFQTELAAASWNAMMAFVSLSGIPDAFDNATGAPGPDGLPDRPPLANEFDTWNFSVYSGQARPLGLAPGEPGYDPDEMGPMRLNGCSFVKPQLCSNIQAIYSVTSQQRNTLKAGGNRDFGRRDWVWQGGGDLVLRYERRNVLGFALDFAEDVTKSNWGAEFTWIEGLKFTDNDRLDGIGESDTFNLTVSADRPTFVNFLNPNRTLFFNSQWFFQYINGYRQSYTVDGPFNVLFTFTVQTGYSQDRLLPSVTWVYDVRSVSGGILPQVSYRFTENFSATVGLNTFWGRWQERQMPIAPVSLDNRVGSGAYSSFQENGLSVVRDRDEVFLRIRYTF